ncbi:MAG: hypothetical protein Q7S22_07000 [Candidatus Micrarchaeota archaeon]|nr:hypothetical protein [Candidatus Micrarchaeota archaeon]
MTRIAIIGYATMMDPRNVRKYNLKPPETVTVQAFQRFFGLPDLADKDPKTVFDSKGKLLITDLGVTTTTINGSRFYNAVAYRDVPEEVVADLDELEKKSYFFRTPLAEAFVRTFPDRARWNSGGNGIYTYTAKNEANLADIGTVQLVRHDVSPNLDYLKRCREAAAIYGEPFRALYDKTTFLADRINSVIGI